MAENSARNTLQWLKQNYSVNVRQEWLDACIEFVKQENRGPSLSQHQLNQQVYEQLLLADLQEISAGSLPAITADRDNILTIQGKHCLQINSVINVGQSAYSQIQKIKGNDDPDSLQDKKINNWEPKIKASRMLFLQLSDGAQQLQGMEYQAIPALQTSLSPGTKIILDGPVTCRLGVLLLSSKNVRVLGGSSEELTEANSMWRVLHNAIGQQPPDPPESAMRLEDQDPGNTQDTTQNSTRPAPVGHPDHQNAQQNTYNNTRSSGNLNSGTSLQNNRNSLQNSSATNASGNWGSGQSVNNSVTGVLRAQGNSGVSHANRGQQSFGSRQSANRNTSKNLQTGQSRNVGVDSYFKSSRTENLYQDDEMLNDYFSDNDDNLFTDEMDENFDFDQLDQIEKRASNVTNLQQDTNCHQNADSPYVNVDDDDELHEMMENFDDDDLSDFDFPEPNNNVRQAENNTSTTTACTSKEPLPGKSGMELTGMSRDNGCGERNSGMGKCLGKKRNELMSNEGATVSGLSKRGKLSLGKSGMAGTRTQTGLVRNETVTEDRSRAFRPQVISTGSESCSHIAQVVSKLKQGNSNNSASTRAGTGAKVHTGKGEPGISGMDFSSGDNTSADDALSVDERSVGVASLESLPFTYLKLILKQMPFTEDVTLRIKAYIATLVSHSLIPGSGWLVTVKINDGTAAMDMDLGPEVLTELLQCPVKIFQKLIQQAKKSTDPELRRQFQQRTEQFQRSLSMVSCLMDVLFTSARPRPLVIRLREPSREDIKRLLMRT